MKLSLHPLKLPCMLMLILLLAACQTTRFQSRPSGTYADCDDGWVGAWLVTKQQADDAIDSLGTLVVPAGCRPMTMHEDGKPPEHFDDYIFSYARVGQMHLLVASERQGKTGTDPADRTGAGKGYADKKAGFVIFRYEVGPQRITVQGIDHAQVARAIVDGTQPGHTEVSNNAQSGPAPARVTLIDNWIQGDGDAIAALLQRVPTLFATQPLLMLQRAPAKREAP